MYPVSANFHTLAIQDAPKTRVRIYFIGEGVDCTDDVAVQTSGTLLVGAVGDTDSNGRIGQNGISFTEMFNPDKNIQIGTAVSYQIGMTLLNTDGALNGFNYGRCKVYLDVYDAANSAWRVCPMGVFVIDIPTKRRVQLVSATGYDQMQLLDTICDSWWSGLNWSGGITLSALLTSMANQLGVKVSTATASAILNSTVSYTEAPFACVEVTYREVLEYIAEATGTIARFDRDGYLDLRFFSAAQIGGNTVTINADTVGNTCLDIDIAEYQAAAIDLLKVKIAEDDIGVTVGSGTNQYTIVNNLFLYGSTATIITNRATPIYNRLNGLGAYTPIQAKLIYDWSLEAGDIINIVRDSTTYPVLIFQQTLTWRGGYVTADILADGDNVRPVMDYDERASYRMSSEMSKKVGDNEIISKINQTAESIQIQASRVDLAGYVTFTNLSTSGQTTIDGGNITTGTIDASTVTVSNINASNISSGTLSAARIAAGSLAIGKLDTSAQNTINGANKQEQLIYRSKAAGTTTLSGTTTWVTNTTGNQDTWTLKRPTYNSSYPVLFIATQRKDVGGTVTCTTPQIDNTTTVIDGGHITTGTIDASVVSVTNLNASNISSGTLSAARIGAGSITANKLDSADINASKILTVGSMTDAAAATVLNSNIAIGGRNLCTGTAVSNEFTKSPSGNWFNPYGVWPISTYGGAAFADTANTQWTASFDYSITGVDTAFTLYISPKTSGSSYSDWIDVASIPVGSSSGHAEGTGTITDGARAYAGTSGVLFGMGNANANAVLTVSNLKFEIGNKATSWTQAPEDVAADIATAQTTADSANSQEQLIYISKVSGTTTQSATTTWVTNATGNQNTWTIKRPTYNSSYPVLFVATQRKSVGGTVTCTTPQIDQTTTVIDGGHITTGTIDASVVSVTNLNASNISSGTLSADRIAAGSLAIGKLNTAAQNTINGANLQEQLIYCSKVSGTTSLSGTTTWVTNANGSQNTWTIKRPTYNSSYPVLFVATQRKDVGGTVTCTTPQIDNTTTVIDGGHITTGTIDASVVSVTNLNASNITSGTMSASKISGGTLTLGGSNNTNGTMTVKDANGNTAATVTNAGIVVNGTNTKTTLNGGAIVIEPPSDATKAVTMEYVSNGLSQSMYLPSGGRQENGFWWKWGAYNAAYLSIPGGDRMAAQQFAQDLGLGANSANGEFLVDSLAASAVLTPKIQTPTSDQVLTITGFPDVTKRRCEASLGGAGWYRAIIYNAYNEDSAKGSSGEIVRIRIVDTSMVNLQHEITLVLAYGKVSFINELSNGTSNVCDEIRYTYSGSFGYVDIHISHSTSITYNVSFDVAARTYAMPNWYAGTLASVADSPTGETVLAAHKFTTDTTYKALTFTRTNNSYYNATDFGRITGYSKDDNIYINLNLRTSAAIPANTSSFEIGVITLPANRQIGTSIYMNIPTQDATAAVLLIISTDGKMTIANYTSSQIGALVFHRAHISNCLIPTT